MSCVLNAPVERSFGALRQPQDDMLRKLGLLGLSLEFGAWDWKARPLLRPRYGMLPAIQPVSGLDRPDGLCSN